MLIRDVLLSLILLVSAFFTLVASLGLIRLPDVYNRMHATTKAGTLGVTGFLLAAIIFFSSESAFNSKLLVTLGFLWLTAPVGAHMMAQAAYHVGHRPWSGTIRDDLEGQIPSLTEVD